MLPPPVKTPPPGYLMQRSGEKQPINFVILTISLLAVCYNCILAFINHNITPLTPSAVVLSEVVLQVAAFTYLLTKGIYEEDIAPLVYLLLTIVLTVFVMAINKQAYIDHLRNVMIIFAFSIMGRLANERTVKLAFKISCFIVLAVLICEIVSVKEYVALFHPAEYFQNTRGVPPATYSDLGLFRGALGFEGRFSFGLIDHRSSSIFLEQVSLANFCGVMVLYLISFSNRLGLLERLLFFSTVVLILLTNDTRTMLIFSLICVAGYFIYPWLPKTLDLLTMPGIIVAGFVIHALEPNVTGDNFVGRINGTVKAFLGMDLQSTIGLQLDQVGIFFDSGYVYIIYGATIFGLILFWLYASLYPGGETVNQRRLGHALSLFLFLNLMIGSTAIFSMKTAGLVWLLVGFLKFNEGSLAKRPQELSLATTG
jgi:putative polymerase